VYGLLMLRDPAPIVLVRLPQTSDIKEDQDDDDADGENGATATTVKRVPCLEFMSLMRNVREQLGLGEKSFCACADTSDEDFLNLKITLEEPFRPVVSQRATTSRSSIRTDQKCKGTECRSKFHDVISKNAAVSCKQCKQWFCTLQCLQDNHPHEACSFAYTSLAGQPVLLAVCDKGKMGDRFPDSLWCMDHRIKPVATHMAMFLQALGRISRYPKPHPSSGGTVIFDITDNELRDHTKLCRAVKEQLMTEAVSTLISEEECYSGTRILERPCAGVFVKVKFGHNHITQYLGLCQSWEQLQLVLRRYALTTAFKQVPYGQQLTFEALEYRLPYALLPHEKLDKLTKAVDDREKAVVQLVGKSGAALEAAVKINSELNHTAVEDVLLLQLRVAAMRLLTFEDALDMELDSRIKAKAADLPKRLELEGARWNKHTGWKMRKVHRKHAYDQYNVVKPETKQKGSGSNKESAHYDYRKISKDPAIDKHSLRFLLSAQCQSGKTGQYYIYYAHVQCSTAYV
jgi:hypothetical protein